MAGAARSRSRFRTLPAAPQQARARLARRPWSRRARVGFVRAPWPPWPRCAALAGPTAPPGSPSKHPTRPPWPTPAAQRRPTRPAPPSPSHPTPRARWRARRAAFRCRARPFCGRRRRRSKAAPAVAARRRAPRRPRPPGHRGHHGAGHPAGVGCRGASRGRAMSAGSRALCWRPESARMAFGDFSIRDRGGELAVVIGRRWRPAPLLRSTSRADGAPAFLWAAARGQRPAAASTKTHGEPVAPPLVPRARASGLGGGRKSPATSGKRACGEGLPRRRSARF